MALYYCAVLLVLPFICSGNAEIALHSSPEFIATVNEHSSAAVFCWTIYDAGTSITLMLEHEGSPLLLNNDDSLIKPASGTCNQDLVPNGKNCENITATFPGDMSLDRTTLTCYLVDESTLARRDETLDVTIIVLKSSTPECNCTCGTGQTEPTQPTVSTTMTTTAPMTETTSSMMPNGDSEASPMDLAITPETKTGSDFKIPFVVVTSALGFNIIIIIILAMALYKVKCKPEKGTDPENPKPG